MAILEVTLEQSLVGQQAINRFTYIQSGTPATVSPSFGLVSALGAIESVGVYPTGGFCWVLALAQSAAVDFVQMSVKNLYSATDFYQVPFVVSLPGQIAGEMLPPTNAFGMRTNRTRLDIRRGFKRFAGVPEAAQSSGILTSTALDNLNALAEVMQDVLEYDDEGNTLLYTPCILGRDAQEDPDNPDKTIYPYYPTESAQLSHAMTSIIWEPYDTVRTQTTRQYGRGL